MTAGLQDVQETAQVGLFVGVGVLERIAHTGLGGEVADHVEALFGEGAVDGVCVA
jgi:hypothetical protein